ncbi:protein rep [Streptomyces atratus]|uniref:protein rep n=1 Tax=Streptomyces atratus TaxID=1893 RepID=UPI00378A32AC
MQVSGLCDAEPEKTATTGTFSGAQHGTTMESDADTRARDAQFEMREALRAVSGLERLEKCGLAVLKGGVTPVLRNGRAGYAGVVTCGSVHVCPCCATSIRRVRQDELDQVGQFWECQSCGLVMMTLTMRHYERDALADLEEKQRQAWKAGFGMNAGRAWRQAKKDFGIRGFVRAWEVTHGPNGWHCHYHVLLFLARPLASGRVEELQHLAFEVWSAALVKVGARMPVEISEKDGKPVGVKIDAPDRGESGQMARYLMKGQDGKTRWGIAAELTRQDVKQGQGGHRTPFEIAHDAIAGDARSIELWQEFVVTATGVRSLYWSNGLRKLLREMGFELDERDDSKVAADEAADGKPIACIPSATWYRHIARQKGRALALLKAAEKGGTRAVRTLIESWGLIWGVDVTEPEILPADGTLPTADEILRRAHRLDMVARADAWRRGFALAEHADIKARAKHFAANPEAPQYVARAEATKQAAADGGAQLAIEDQEHDEHARARADFIRQRNLATTARADDIAAALDRVRHPDRVVPQRVSLRKRRKPVLVDAPEVTPPPPGAASPTCRSCGGRLAPALVPYGHHMQGRFTRC